jgi:hypothetical protein
LKCGARAAAVPEPVAVWDHVLVAKQVLTVGSPAPPAIKCIPCACVHVFAVVDRVMLVFTLVIPASLEEYATAQLVTFGV